MQSRNNQKKNNPKTEEKDSGKKNTQTQKNTETSKPTSKTTHPNESRNMGNQKSASSFPDFIENTTDLDNQVPINRTSYSDEESENYVR